MSWGKKAVRTATSLARKSALTSARRQISGIVSSLPLGTHYGALGGFRMMEGELRLPTMADLVNLVSGTSGSGDVLGLIQSLNSLRTAFTGSSGIAGLLKNVPSDLGDGFAVSTGGQIALASKLGNTSKLIGNIQGIPKGAEHTAKALSDLEQTVNSGGKVTTISSGDEMSVRSLREPSPVIRNNAGVIVEIDGQVLSDIYVSRLQQVMVHLTHEHRMSTVKILFNNEDMRFTDDPIFDEYKPIRVRFGYASTGYQPVGGTFFSLGPKIICNGTTGRDQIEITAVSEEFMMGIQEERKIWSNMSYSQIVQKIAEKYGFLAAVQNTHDVKEHTAQVNESDWKFLESLAVKMGYQVYIERGILHFHKPLYRDSGIRMVYNEGDNSQISGFTTWSEPLQNGFTVEATQIDPISGNTYTANSSSKDDPISQVGIGEYQERAKTSGKAKRWSDITSFAGKSSKKYLYHGSRTPSNLFRETQGYSENSRWILKGLTRVIGVEWLQARDMIELAGIGHASGKYYMTDVYHRYEGGIYTSEVMVTRTWTGSSGESLEESEPVLLTEVRE